MKLRFLACVLGLSLVAVGCDRTADNEVAEDTTTMNDFGATGTGGTTTTADEPASVAEPAQDRTTGTAARDAGELPGTASPLGLAGLIGALSLAGAAGARYLRRW